MNASRVYYPISPGSSNSSAEVNNASISSGSSNSSEVNPRLLSYSLIPAAIISAISILLNIFVVYVFCRIANIHKRSSVYFASLAFADALVALCLVIILSYYSSFDSFAQLNEHCAPELVKDYGNVTLLYNFWTVSWKHHDAVVTHHPLLLFLEGTTRYITLWLVIERSLILWSRRLRSNVTDEHRPALKNIFFFGLLPSILISLSLGIFSILAQQPDTTIDYSMVTYAANIFWIINYIAPLVLIVLFTASIVVKLKLNRATPANKNVWDKFLYLSIAVATTYCIFQIPDMVRLAILRREKVESLKAVPTQMLVVILYWFHVFNTASNIVVCFGFSSNFKKFCLGLKNGSTEVVATSTRQTYSRSYSR